MSLLGKVVLVTGASSGIGANAAIHLSKLGANVAIVGRDSAKLHGVAEQIIAAGSPEPLEIVADVNEDTDEIITKTIQKFGKLDVLVNNAGIARFAKELLGTLEIYDSIMNTNVRSVLALTKAAVPHLEKTKGNVINVSSIAGTNVIPGGVAYTMSKAALDHFTRNAAVDLAPKGIRVNAIKPGAVDTPIFGTVGLDDEAKQKFLEGCKTSYPAGRAGVVGDTSNAIAFLAQDASSFITGHLLMVDGGKHLVK